MPFARNVLLSLLVITLTVAVGQAQIDFDASRRPPDPMSALRHHTSLNDAMQSVSGSVRWSNNTPAKNATVELVDPVNGHVLFTSYTDDGGMFTMPQVAGGQYQIVAESGTAETSAQLTVESIETTVNLVLSAPAAADAGGPYSVSVAQMQVPEKARKAMKKAQEAVDKRDILRAQQYIAEALAIDPNYAGALTLRGILSMDAKNYPAAENDFDRAIKADNNYSLAYLGMGAAYNIDGKWNEAIRSLDRGVELNPKSWQGYFELAKSYLATRDYQSALSQLQKAQEIKADYAPIHLLRAHILLAMRNYDEAIPELEAYLQANPNGIGSSDARNTLDKVKAFVAVNH
jgi:Tfp pilus assembly protein PilF